MELNIYINKSDLYDFLVNNKYFHKILQGFKIQYKYVPSLSNLTLTGSRISTCSFGPKANIPGTFFSHLAKSSKPTVFV